MLTSLRKFLTPPVFEGDEQTRRARILHSVLLVLVIGLAIFVILSLTQDSLAATLVMAVSELLILASFGLLYRGHLTIPAVVVSLSGLMATTFILITGSGIHGVSTMGYAVVLVVASLVLGQQGAILLGGLIIAAGLGIIYAEVTGLITNRFSALTDFSDFFFFAPLIAMTAGILYVLVNSLSASVEKARRGERALTKSNRELEALRDTLEQRVETRTHELTEAQAHTQTVLVELAEASRIAALASFELEISTQTLVFSDRFFELLGTTAQVEGGHRQPMGEAIHRFIHPDEAQRVLPEVQRLVAAHDTSVRQLEYRLIRRDGAIRTFAFRFDVTRDDRGIAVQARGAVQDITERKRFEADLARRANELTLLSEGARIVSSTLNLQEVVNRLLQQLPRLVDFHTATIQLINAQGERQQIGGVSLDANRQITLLAPADHFLRPVADDPLIASVVRSRAPVIIAQTQADPRWEVLPETQHINAWLAAPLMAGQEVVGLLILDHTRLGAYTTELVPLLTAFTAQAASALQNARIYDDAQKRAAELETVTQLASAIATIQDPHEMLQTVVDLVKPSFKLYHAHIYLLDETGAQLVLTAGAGVVGHQMASEKRSILLNHEHSVVARAARTRQAIIVNEVVKEPDFLPNPLLPHTQAELAVPLIVGAQLLGVLDVQADQVNHFTTSDARIQTILAAQIATALQNARSFARSEKSLKELDELTRRLTRENWEGYLEQTTHDRLGYQYDGGALISLTENPSSVTEVEPSLMRPVVLHGEAIGRLTAEGAGNVEDTQIILEAVAQGLSTHIDNLRLTEQTQKALAEQVRLAAEMDSQRTTLETVLLNIPAGVFVAEAPSGKHLLSNSRAQTLLGRGIAAEANAESAAEVYPAFRADTEEVYPSAELPLVRGMFGETARVDDMEVRRPDGSRAWLEVVGAPIRDARGRITASVAVFQDITERRQADAEIRRRNEELSALNRVGSVLTSSFNLRTILQATAREVATILQVRNTSIALLDSSHQNLSVVADYSAVADIPTVLGLTLALTEAPSSYRVFETKRAIVVENAQTNPMVSDLHELLRARRTQSMMIVPLLARGAVIGTVTVETGEVGHAFSAEEMALVETVAGQIASAVENIRLFEDAQRRARELEAVAEVGTAASTLLDPQMLLQTVVDLTKASFSLYHAHVYMLNDAGNTLVLTAGAGLVGQGMVAEGRRILLSAEQSLVARAARSRRGVIVNDVRAEPGFLPHPLLTETRAELAVPLIAGDKVLGVFDVQSEIPGRFTEEDVRIQTTLANQVAVALQNAATFSQVAEARSQIEAQARRLTREGWADFFNAVDHQERLGYMYDQTRVVPLVEADSGAINGHGVSVPIIVTGETVGSVQIESAAGHNWDETEKAIAALVAQRLSQQVENLRLLDQAQRYRVEAENAIRRLTREGWQSYDVGTPAFVYNQNQVLPMLDETDAGTEPAVISQPITVRGEAIGQVGVAGLETVSAQQTELVALVSQRLSSHIENLRLFDQTQTALSTTQSLYQISSRIAAADDLQEVLAAVGEGLPIPGINRLLLFTHELDERGELEAVVVSANWHSSEGMPPTPVGQRYPRVVFNTFRLMLSPTAVFFNDLQTDPRTDANTLDVAKQLNIRAVVSLPLRTGARQVGSLLLEGEAPHEFTDNEIQPYLSVAETVAISLENRRLAEETQAALADTEDQAHRLARLNELGEELSRANTLDDILQIAAVKASEIVQADRATITLLNATGDYFQVIGLSGQAMGDSSGTAGASLAPTLYPLAGTTVELAVKQRRLVVVTDPALNVLPEMKRFVEQGLRTFMNVPLIAGGKVIGTLNVSSKQPGVYGRRDENLMLQVASLLAASLESLRLLEQTQKRAAELETVAKVSATASAILDSEQLLQMVVDLTKGSFGLYHTHAYMLDETGETLVLTAGAGVIGSQMVAEGRRIPMSWEQSLVARAARTRQPVVVNDVRADPDFLPHPLLPDTRAELAVPMVVGDTVLGVFDVQANSPNYFTEEDVRIQNTLAAQIAVALNNANLYADQSATVTRLRELDHLKSSFLANMSHELRTPLNSILGFTEVILEELDGPLTEQMENDLRIVYKNGQHLLHLINDVLDMAKIESGKLTLHLERLDLTEVLEEVIGLTNPLASAKDIELRLDAEFGTLEAEVDRIRIRQVMINIINNAIKFTEHGHIDIRAVPRDDMIRVTVKDTGLGIPPDHLESVFQEFTQVDTTTTRKAGGTGLGLPISRHLVEMHGGKLWAESTGIAGEGSTFIVELPVNAVYTAPAED